MKRKIKVEVRLTRLHNHEDRYHLVIEDRASSIVMLDIMMNAKDVAASLTGASAECEAELGALSLIGRKMISVTRAVRDVTEPVPGAMLPARRAELLAEAAAQLELEQPGYHWRARGSDLGNHHCKVSRGSDEYNVIFFGHEPRTEEP